MEDFIAGYIEAALWADWPTDDIGHELPVNNGPSPELIKWLTEDATTFWERHHDLFTGDAESNLHYSPGCTVAAYAGHDFWLTRGGHGCGYWDGNWAEPAAALLTAGSKLFPDAALYMGDDGYVYAY